MSFWINDRKGVAFQDLFDPDPYDSSDCIASWNAKDQDFSIAVPLAEEGDWWRGARCVSEDEAFAYMRKRSAAVG